MDKEQKKEKAVENEDLDMMCEGESFQEYEDLSGYEEEEESKNTRKHSPLK